jgi:hypothetical protein
MSPRSRPELAAPSHLLRFICSASAAWPAGGPMPRRPGRWRSSTASSNAYTSKACGQHRSQFGYRASGRGKRGDRGGEFLRRERPALRPRTMTRRTAREGAQDLATSAAFTSALAPSSRRPRRLLVPQSARDSAMLWRLQVLSTGANGPIRGVPCYLKRSTTLSFTELSNLEDMPCARM